jgi:hypothetical protein
MMSEKERIQAKVFMNIYQPDLFQYHHQTYMMDAIRNALSGLGL